MAQGLVGGLVGGIVAGSVGEVAGALLGAAKPLYEDAAEEVRWHARAYLSGPPGNHDLERALHAAWLTGVLAVLRQHEVALLGERAPRPGSLRDRYDRLRRGLAKVLDRDIPDPAHLEIWHVRDWCHQQLDRLSTLAEEEDASVLGTLEAALTPGFAAPGAAGDPRIATARDLAWQRLEEGVGARGVRLPASFKARFDSTDRASPGWFACFFAYVQDTLKENGKVRTAFFARQSAVVRAFVARMDAALARVAEDSSATRRHTEALLARQAGTDAKLDWVIALVEQSGAFARAQDAGISEAAVRRIVEKLGAQGLGPEDLLPWLDNWIDSAREQLARHVNEDAAFAAAMEEANRRFRAGRGDEASAALMAEFDREERDEQARQEERKRRRLRLLEEAIRYDELALDAPAAVAKLRVMAEIEGATTADARGDWLLEQASLYQERGEQKGENAALLIAIATWQATLAERTRHRAPLVWAGTQNNLGNALQVLGAREAGTERLEEAVVAYRAALTEWTRKRAPLEWAMTQNNLGNALLALGEREAGTARLEEAVAAYRAALEEWTRERAPLDWALTQNNVGNALLALGERESGTVRLEQGVAAYRAALEERTRERMPLDSALTQNNLGNALARIGARESGTARLEEAVYAFRAALQERTPERVPLGWAATQNNLGNALLALGTRESGTARLEQAVAAYRAALEERTRERVPLEWAMTQNNLGAALVSLGERGSGAAHLEAAVVAYRAALEERTRDRVPLDWATTQNNLGIALAMLGAREGNSTRLAEAVAAFHAALEERTRERVPFLWAQTMENLALLEESWGDRTGDAAHWRAALGRAEAALEEYRQAGAAFYVEKATRLRDGVRRKLEVPVPRP